MSHRQHARARIWWPPVRRLLTIAFFVLVAVLLVSQARTIDWGEVFGVIRNYPRDSLLWAAALAALSHLVYSSYDLIGRAWTSHRLPVRQVMPVTFVSYAFNLNLGSLVGGFAFRFRLYSRLGLRNDIITRVLGLSLATNWLGYLVLAGGVFALRIITPPAGWTLGATALQALGVAMVLAAAAYVAMCAVSRRRSWTLRGHELALPPLRMALAQLVASCANWMLIGAVVFVLLQQKVAYPTVLGVLLIAAVAGVLTHIPAGLGVLEAVFIALLGAQVPRGELLAALLAYRALYYLAPLLLATAVYLALEAHAKKLGQAPRPAPARPSRG